jgi:hypothetical protein
MFSFRSRLRITARCVLYYNTSWQGDPLRVPVASPRLLVLWDIESLRTIKTFRRFITCIVWPMHHQSGERSCYPRHLHDQGDFAPLWNPRSKGRSWLSPLNTPSTNPTRIGCAPTLSAVGSRPAFRLLDFEQGFRSLHIDQGNRPWIRICNNPCLAEHRGMLKPYTIHLPLQFDYLSKCYCNF